MHLSSELRFVLPYFMRSCAFLNPTTQPKALEHEFVHALRFLGHFLRAPRRTGAVAPSSRKLAEVMVEAAQVAEASAIVEFGPGTGVFTERIVARMREDAACLTIEINPVFAETVRKRFPGVYVAEGSAADAKKHLAALEIEHCDCIVSGLPWASFDDSLQDALLDGALDALRPGGRFVTFAYLQSPFLPTGRRFAAKLRERFAEVRTTRTVWWNLPPAFAYCAVK